MKHARDERVAGSKFSTRPMKKPATENFERGLENLPRQFSPRER
jgi:hypothetical protein